MILLTGASGMVGKAILKATLHRGIRVRPVYRSTVTDKIHPEARLVCGPHWSADWTQVVKGIDVVIHAAGRAHLMRDDALDPLFEYRLANVESTMNLARYAAAAGVRRFVFISSIKVNGEVSELGFPFTSDDIPSPADDYSLSKFEAEEQLKQLADKTGMEVTIIRPPVIYGPGVKGNFASLINLVRLGFPLPLGGVTYNRRSLVGLDNLVDLILLCSIHPKAANQILLVSDGEDLSTTELVLNIGKSLKKPARLFRIPSWFILSMAGLFGKRVSFQRVLCSLQVDISKTCELLDWKPTVSVVEGLRRTVE